MAPTAVLREKIKNETDQQRAGKRIYNWKEREAGHSVLKRAIGMSLAERNIRSFQMPNILKLPHLLTKKDLEYVGWIEAEENTIYQVEAPGLEDYDFFVKITPEMLERWHPELAARYRVVREKLLCPVLHAKFEKHMGKTYTLTKGNCYELGVSHQPTKGPSTLQIGGLSRADIADCNWIHNELMAVSSATIKEFLPDMRQDRHGRAQEWHQSASMTPGPENNREATSLRVNITTPNTAEQLAFKQEGKKFADAHTDQGDFPPGVSALMCMSSFSPGHFPGRFNSIPLQISTTATPGCIILCSARLRHVATGEGPYPDYVPVGDPRRCLPGPLDHLLAVDAELPYKRIMSIAYPNGRWMKPSFEHLNPEVFTEAFARLFTNRLSWVEWLARLGIANEDQVRYWLKKAAEEDGVDIGQPGQEGLGDGRSLLEIASEKCIKTLKGETKALKKIAGDKKDATKAAQAAAIETEVVNATMAAQVAANSPAEDTPTAVEAEVVNEAAVAGKKGRKKKNRKDRVPWTPRTPHKFPVIPKRSAEYYQQLFTTKFSDEQVIVPRIELIQECLNVYKKSNPDMAKLLKGMKYLDCGHRMVTKRKAEDISKDNELDDAAKKAAQNKWDEENKPLMWTHLGYNHVANFDPDTDWIPGNPNYQPKFPN